MTAFDTPGDEQLAREISRRMTEKLTTALAVIMRLHAAVTVDDDTLCGACLVKYPCPTWIAAAGGTQ